MKQSKNMRMTAIIYFFLAADGAELDFQPDICKEPEYHRTGHFARILEFVMLCDRMKSTDILIPLNSRRNTMPRSTLKYSGANF